jgi:eukaryotic-like serine/threonine-protein kinase
VTAIPGQLADALQSRYLIERQLGRGGMATVYLAQDVRHDRPVALKVLHSYVVSTLGPERFLQEIRLAARLQHPHILTVFDSGESGGHLWFTMPYVEGESLRDRLRRDHTVPPDEAIRIAREAGQALEYAHRHGVIHRDIKPENILLTQDGNTLIADFGIARSLDPAATSNLTAAGMVVGTPSYMSPEQAMGEPTDGRSDVYSLGCVLYEMLTGRPPFTGTTAQAVVGKHLSQPAPPIVNHGLASPAISQAIARALAKSADERFSSAAEFVRALEPAAAATRRSRTRIAVFGLVMLGLLVLAWMGSRQWAERSGTTGSAGLGGERRLSQITVGGGVEAWPAWSPDGKKLVYSGEAEGFRQLFLRTLATGEDQRLTRTDRDDIQPAWSPDGRRLAFVRSNTDRGKLEPSDINAWYTEGGDIWVRDLDSGTESRLVADAFGPAWSPDGKRLAFDARWAGPRRIWAAEASGRNPRQITTDSNDAVVHADPRWSPDGKHLAYRVIEGTKWDIAAINLTTLSVTRLTNDIVPDLDPAWSPDGRRVYYASGRGGGVNLWQTPVTRDGVSTGHAEQLTTGAGDDVQPAPSPDGRRIAFTVLGINSDIWRLPVSPSTGRPTGEAEPVVATSRVESRGTWSPDGRSIAFNSDRRGDMNIWIRSLENGSERQLTQGSGGDYQPNWSPNGKSIVFFSARSGNADIWRVQVDDGSLTQLTGDPSTETNPFYSPDGSHIAYLSERSGRSEVWVMNADGSDQRRLYDSQAGGHFLRWTADGSAVVFRSENGAQTQVIAAPLAGGTPMTFPPISSGAHLSFSPDRTLVLDVRGHKSLWVHPVDGRQPYKIFEFPDGEVRIDYPVWAPDGKWVLFDRAAPRSGDVWMLTFGQ